MIIQFAILLLVLIGWIFNLPVLFLLCGGICLCMDIYAFLNSQLNPILPIILYVVGYFVFGSWVGIFYGAIVGNLLEMPIVIGAYIWSWISTLKVKGSKSS